MRDFSAKNQVEIYDAASGDTHILYYRVPSNAEREAYQAGLIERKGKKIVDRSYRQRLKFGARILTGFKKGTFGIEGRAFSSDSSDPDYRQDWKTLLQEQAGDIISCLGRWVFEGTSVKVDNPLEIEIPQPDSPEDEEQSPFLE